MKQIDKLNFWGYDLSPLPLDFTNELTTTKWLGALLNKINSTIDFINNIHSNIVEDLETGGDFFKLLSEKFATQIIELENIVNEVEDRLKALEYSIPILGVEDCIRHYNIGEPLNGINFKYNISNNSEDIVSVELYKDGVLVNALNGNNVAGYINCNDTISDTTTFTVKVFDGVSEVTQNIDVIFTPPVFTGLCDDVPNENIIKSTFDKRLEYDNLFYYVVENCNDKRPCIVSSYDLIIYDENDNLITDSFEVTDIVINLGQNYNFKIYTLVNKITVEEFKFKINY